MSFDDNDANLSDAPQGVRGATFQEEAEALIERGTCETGASGEAPERVDMDDMSAEDIAGQVEDEANEESGERQVEESVETGGKDGAKNARKSKFVRIVKAICKRYFIDAFTGMAQGLFCTLIIGTILAQIASWFPSGGFKDALSFIANVAKSLMGAGIGIGIAHKLGAKPLVIFSAAVTGLVGACAGNLVSTMTGEGASAFSLGAPGNPIGSYVVSLITIELASLYAGKTKLDIVLVPLGMIVVSLAGIFVAWPFIKLIDLLAQAIVLLIEAGTAVKVITGIVVAIVMGVLLTMPTSSAAIWVAIAGSQVGLGNPDVFAIAGGAAVAGCAAHMIGFAVATFRENGVGGLISQGIGTSMLQIPNIMKKPLIMLPEVVASAFAGLAAVLLGLRCNASGGGMGTSGLVGIFGAVEASQAAGLPAWRIAVAIIICMFLIPAFVSLLVSELLIKAKKIEGKDFKLEN